MNRFSTSELAIDALKAHLDTLYKPYAGAMFRFALAPEDGQMRFLTAQVLFSPTELASRPSANYKRVFFIERWCATQENAVEFLSTLFSGNAHIDGQKIPFTFSYSDFDHRTYPSNPELWARWELRSAIHQDRSGAWKEIYLPQMRLTGRDLKTYLGPNEAINDWVYEQETHDNYSNDIPYKDHIITVLPDTRARVLSARWLQEKLHLEFEINIPDDQLRLEINHLGSKKRSQRVPLKETRLETPIPADATSLHICFIDQEGEIIEEIGLHPPEYAFGRARLEPAPEIDRVPDIAHSDLDAAELSAVEFAFGGLSGFMPDNNQHVAVETVNQLGLSRFRIDELRSELSSINKDAVQFFESMALIAEFNRLENEKEHPAAKSQARKPDWEFLNDEQRAGSRNIIERISLFAPRLMNAVVQSPLVRSEKGEIEKLLRSMADALRFRITLETHLSHGNSAKTDISVDAEDARKAFETLCGHVEERISLLSPSLNETQFAVASLENSGMRSNTAFIMMQISESDTASEDVKNAIKETFKEFGINAIRADEIEHSGQITSTILEEIRTSQFLIADLTGERPSVYYEVGYAHALGKNPILYRQQGAKLHFDLSVHNVPEYKGISNLKTQLRKRLLELTKNSTQP